RSVMRRAGRSKDITHLFGAAGSGGRGFRGRGSISRETAPPPPSYRVYSAKSVRVKHSPPLFGSAAFMRILLLADIHGNWPALQAIPEPYDVCLCLGDLVDYGLEPAPCIDWVRQHAQHTVRGNHDHGVAQDVTVAGRNGFKYLTGVTRGITRSR